ncbi:sensor histidine kinase [Fibrella aquatilis]|uniref:Histidine kinase n=1 Tax=Fibrella aquatilis TaxID=2817059 RepID=A0A939G4K0_9BACT|nr:histidine kinase [Fibrella aquatilis]MBO0931771.1 histidine kinase [Fibrella aquatilis]
MSRTVALVFMHLLGCVIFLALPYLFVDDGLAKLRELSTNPHEQRNLASYLFTIAFFYTNYFVLIPRLFFGRKFLLYGICVLGCFIVINQLVVAINARANGPGRPGLGQAPPPPPAGAYSPPPRNTLPPGGPPPDGPPPNTPPRPRSGASDQPGLPPEISQTFFLFLAGLLLSLAIRINNRWRETERERLNAELSYLKAQINPHFLFNTLNSIYSLAIIESPGTASAIVQLSSFLRYVIAEAHKDRVALSHELAYISQYIALQKLRLADTIPVQYSTRGDANGLQIAPLILISFIENAFKYGASPEDPSPIAIAIDITAQGLHCRVFNKKVQLFTPATVANGIGLTNTKNRLNLLYPSRHQLIINDEPTSYTVDLILTLS